jgi:excisionase family DNA binding protein
MTLAELRQLPTVLTVEEAGRLLNLGRSAAYDAVKRGELPVLRFGRRLVVPTARVLAMLGLDPERDKGAPAGAPVDQLDPAAAAEDRYGS